MKLKLTGRHYEVTPNLRKHVTEKISRLDHYNEQIQEVEVVLFRDHVSEIAEGKLHVGHTVLTAKAETDDMYASVTELTDRMLVQLKRWEGRLRDRKRNNHSHSAGHAP